jgi:mannose/fructose/N-acetylgalactosamine-specific phosphotransferase system component IID
MHSLPLRFARIFLRLFFCKTSFNRNYREVTNLSQIVLMLIPIIWKVYKIPKNRQGIIITRYKIKFKSSAELNHGPFLGLLKVRSCKIIKSGS